MIRILVTGASGFIGRQCLPKLVAKGYEVHAVSRQRASVKTSPGVSWHERNLLQPGCPTELISQVRPEYLLHLAWYAVPDKFWEARQNIEWVRASLELFCAFADNAGKRLVAAGSCSEYECGMGECQEDRTPLLPSTLYGTSKHALGSILHPWSRQVGLSSAWGRVFYLYGPYENPSRLVAYVIRTLLHGKLASCSGGTQVLDFIHVEDAASAFIALAESEVQGTVNIGSGIPVAVRDVVQEIGRQLKHLELIQFGARSSGSELRRFWANSEKLAKEVGWTPRYNLASGIEQTIEWWRSSAATAVGDRTPREEE
jgi:nucleoside-diphosphate-sugar epimerase